MFMFVNDEMREVFEKERKKERKKEDQAPRHPRPAPKCWLRNGSMMSLQVGGRLGGQVAVPRRPLDEI